jgi:hypothetical protein
MAAPFGSVADALAAVPAKGVIYVCYDETLRLNESVTINKDVTILGRLDCDTATKAAGPSLLGGTGVAPSIKISAGTDVFLADLDVTSPDLSAIAMPNGESSAVVWVDAATVDLQRCVLTAGKGAPGKTEVEDMAVAPKPMPAPDRGTTDGAQDGCDGTTSNNGGGMGGTNTCGGVEMVGGSGGVGTNGSNGGAGTAGDWVVGATCQVADPACGQPGNPDVGAGCTAGHVGGNGENGMPGPGGDADGTLGGAYVGGAGGLGAGPGIRGGGGGGGGGGNQCTGAGPGGGGGGAGGCGGAPGKGGGGGGGSFALVSVMGTVTLTDSVLTSDLGGQGGGGAPGQKGALGGDAAAPGNPFPSGGACAGGQGGDGGRGGAGGGGRGGPSVGIAYTGDEPTQVGTGNMITFAATAAPGGAGGSNDPTGLGAEGITEATHAF